MVASLAQPGNASPVSNSDTLQAALPRPGKVLRVVLIALLVIWITFAVGLNWAGASRSVFDSLCGSTPRILQGEVWRLFTAPLMHEPSGTIGHIFSSLLGLYFLSPSLESRWGSQRFGVFLLLSAVTAYGVQMAFELILPASVATRLVPNEYWYGALPIAEAVSIAWALSFRGRTLQLLFVPITSNQLIVLVVVFNVMFVLAGSASPSGLIAPFGGMLAGWAFGGGTPSPARKLWLKLRLAQLDVEARNEARARRQRVDKAGFRVISGGRDDDDETRDPPDKRTLN